VVWEKTPVSHLTGSLQASTGGSSNRPTVRELDDFFVSMLRKDEIYSMGLFQVDGIDTERGFFVGKREGIIFLEGCF